MPVVTLALEGNVPSKKNQRINTKDGLSFASKAFTDWQDAALIAVRRQTRHRFLVPVQIEVIIYFATLGKADVDNRLTSILDMLTEALVLKDDKWENVPLMKVEAAYRPKAPGAFIRIEELPAGFFGAEYEVAAAKRDKRNRK
mgnify:CR=1 FL=1